MHSAHARARRTPRAPISALHDCHAVQQELAMPTDFLARAHRKDPFVRPVRVPQIATCSLGSTDCSLPAHGFEPGRLRSSEWCMPNGEIAFRAGTTKAGEFVEIARSQGYRVEELVEIVEDMGEVSGPRTSWCMRNRIGESRLLDETEEPERTAVHGTFASAPRMHSL